MTATPVVQRRVAQPIRSHPIKPVTTIDLRPQHRCRCSVCGWKPGPSAQQSDAERFLALHHWYCHGGPDPY